MDNDDSIGADEVRRIFGDITDHAVAEIVGSGVGVEELEKIALLLAGDTDHLRERGRLAPASRRLYELLLADEERWEEERG